VILKRRSKEKQRKIETTKQDKHKQNFRLCADLKEFMITEPLVKYIP